MLSYATKVLADDHDALDEVLGQLHEALIAGDVEASHAGLDLFWARIAVHIRAEHLHLFKAVINRLSNTVNHAVATSLNEARLLVERLRADHDFFMHELGRSIGILRKVSNATDRGAIEGGMSAVREAVLEVQKRLIMHNELEENQVYQWATLILNEQEQVDLANRISAELANHPSRFSPETWSNRQET